MSALILMVAAMWSGGVPAEATSQYDVEIRWVNVSPGGERSILASQALSLSSGQWVRAAGRQFSRVQQLRPGHVERIILLKDENGQSVSWIELRVREAADATRDNPRQGEQKIYPFFYEPF